MASITFSETEGSVFIVTDPKQPKEFYIAKEGKIFRVKRENCSRIWTWLHAQSMHSTGQCRFNMMDILPRKAKACFQSM